MTFLKVLFTAGLLLSSHVILAAGIANNVQVVSVRVDASGKGYISFQGALVSAPPQCGSGYNNSLAFSTKTEAGRAILTTALTAKVSGSPMYALGTGSCSLYSVIEDYSFGFIK